MSIYIPGMEMPEACIIAEVGKKVLLAATKR